MTNDESDKIDYHSVYSYRVYHWVPWVWLVIPRGIINLNSHSRSIESFKSTSPCFRL